MAKLNSHDPTMGRLSPVPAIGMALGSDLPIPATSQFGNRLDEVEATILTWYQSVRQNL